MKCVEFKKFHKKWLQLKVDHDIDLGISDLRLIKSDITAIHTSMSLESINLNLLKTQFLFFNFRKKTKQSMSQEAEPTSLLI